jgi:plastocyanin
MRRLPAALARAAIALAAIAFAATACAGVPGPGWTFAPPTVPPPSQPAASGAASVAPTAPASASPFVGPSSAPASGAPAPSAPSGGTGAVVQVSALNVNFEQTQVGAPAGVAFLIHFNNKDTGVLHDIAIMDASGTQVFLGTAITGPAEADYQVPALPAGSYRFVCTFHPGMSGMFMVGG